MASVLKVCDVPRLASGLKVCAFLHYFLCMEAEKAVASDLKLCALVFYCECVVHKRFL